MTTPLECRSCGRGLASAGLAVCPHCGQSLAADAPTAGGGAGDPLWMELDSSPTPTPAARPLSSPPIPNVPNIPIPPSQPVDVPRMRPVEVPIDDFEEKLARIDRRRRVSERADRRDRPRERSGNRRRRPPVEPRRGNWTVVVGIVAIVVVVGSGILAVVASVSQQQRMIHRGPPPAFEKKAAFAVPVDVGDLPADPADIAEVDRFAAELKFKMGIVDPRVQAELRLALEELGNLIRRGDEAAVARKISGSRFLEELLSCAHLQQADVLNFGLTARGAELAIAQTFVRNASDWHWSDFEVKRVTPIDRQTMKVLTRYKTPRGTKIVTWWLSKRRDGWRVYDYEHYWSVRGVIRHAGILDSLNLAIGPPEEFETIRALRDAHEILNGDQSRPAGVRADRILDRLREDQVPKLLVPAYRSMRTQTLWRRQQYVLALAENERCRQAEPGRASLDLWDAMLQYDLKHFPEALERFERFHRTIGETSESLRELGTVLVALNRKPDARAAFRKSLDDLPDDPNTYFWFLTSVDPGRKEDDVGRRFMALAQPAKEYERYAADCKNAGDFESLRQLATAMCGIDWQSPLPREHLALVEARLDAPEQALATFRKAMALETITHHRASAATEFLREMANSNHALEAYKDLADAPAVVVEPEVLFQVLAENARYRPALLRHLVRLHGAKHGKDPHLRMFRADILAADGKDAEADAMYTAAAAQLGEGPEKKFVDLFRYNRLFVRFRLGKVVESLEDFEPRQQVFTDLASMCVQAKKYDLLDALVERYLKDDPQNVVALNQRMQCRIRQGKTEEGIALYRKLAARDDKDMNRQQTEMAFQLAMVDTKHALEAYRAAKDPKEAFRFLSGDLQQMGRQAEFDKLIEAYAADHPGDPMVPLVRARRLVRQREYAAAIEQFDLAARGKFDPKTYIDPRRESIFARYKAGQPLAACRDIEPRTQTFAQLAIFAIQDRDWPLVEKLIASHRERSPQDPVLDEATARLLVQQRKPAEAAALFKKIVAMRKPGDDRGFPMIVGYDPWQTFLADMAASDQPLEAYDRAPDKQIAFQTLAVTLGNAKKADLLSQLVEWHAKEPACRRGWPIIAASRIC